MRIPFANTESRYGALALLIHWAMAAVLVVLLGMGWYMTGLPDAGFDREKIVLILAHKSIGMVAFAAGLARLVWRNFARLPQLAGEIPDWQKAAAYFVHFGFYALMLALPLSGWLMSSAGGFPVYLWLDRVELPDLVHDDPSLFRLLVAVHGWLAWALAAFLLAHAGAALAHHFIRRDDTLRKMLP